MRLAHRVSLVVVAGLLPLIAMEAYNSYSLHESRRSEVERSATQQALLVSSELDRMIEGTKNVLTAVAQVPVVKTGQTQACSAYLGELARDFDYLVSISVVDARGQVRCFPEKVVPGLNVADRPYFREAMASETLVVGSYIIGKVNKVPLLPIAMAISEGQQKTAVVVATINLRWLSDQLARRGYPEGGSVTVADKEGIIIARQPFPDRFVGTRIPQAFQYLLTEKRPGAIEVLSQDGTKRILGYVPVGTQPHGLYVSAGLSTEASFQTLNTAVARQAGIAGLAVVSAIGMAALISRRFVTSPIERVKSVLERWQHGDSDARTQMTAAEGEIGAIGEEVDRAIATVTAREETIRVLLHELSHRSKNQLTLVISIARQLARSSKTVSEFEQSLSDRLIALARSDDLLLKSGGSSVSLAALLDDQIAVFNLQPGRIRTNGPAIEMSRDWATYFGLAVHELATNSLKHGVLSSDQGSVEVNWSSNENGLTSFEWREVGRRSPQGAPTRKGFGTTLLTEVIPAMVEGTADLRINAEGMVWSLRT